MSKPISKDMGTTEKDLQNRKHKDHEDEERKVWEIQEKE